MPLLLVPRVALLAGPVALAFFAGGYADRPRLVALGVAGLTLALAALLAPRPLLPASRASRLALGAFLALVVWVALSTRWAPLDDAAADDAERWALYGVAMLAGVLCWRSRAAARLVEPAVAAGITLVTGYGLAGRLIPALVPQTPSVTAAGRFEQPLTYWNASGMLAALGLVLCARIAGDRERPGWLRCCAVAAGVALGTAVVLSFSRGALAALAGGLLVLLVVAPTWSQLRGLAIVLETAALGLVAPVLSDAVRTLTGSAATRQHDGALVALAMLVVAAIGVGLMLWNLRNERDSRLREGRIALPRWAGGAAAAVVALLVLLPVLARDEGAPTSVNPVTGATTARLTSLGSSRYDYWRVARDAWLEQPVAGLGTGGYAVAWLAARPKPERVRDVHSLPLEVLTELGLIGALLLLATGTGVVLAARRVLTEDPALAAGPVAGLVVYAVHASIDWDWELPATGLVAITLVAMLLAQAPAERRPQPGATA